jgi:molecular chaperone DnaK
VSAKDKATGKEQAIEIKASSGLSDEEVDRMVQDAEAHAEEDKKFQELVGVRNQADNMIHAVTKSLNELGDKVNATDKANIEKAVEDVKEALKGDDKAMIEAKTQALAEMSGKIAQQAYGDAGAAGADGFTDAAQAASAAQAGAKAKDDNVVDAEFEEVKDDKK